MLIGQEYKFIGLNCINFVTRGSFRIPWKLVSLVIYLNWKKLSCLYAPLTLREFFIRTLEEGSRPFDPDPCCLVTGNKPLNVIKQSMMKGGGEPAATSYLIMHFCYSNLSTSKPCPFTFFGGPVDNNYNNQSVAIDDSQGELTKLRLKH
ncbi:hypothetical protein LguiB_034501 [Lonicera macranthoides]